MQQLVRPKHDKCKDLKARKVPAQILSFASDELPWHRNVPALPSFKLVLSVLPNDSDFKADTTDENVCTFVDFPEYCNRI